MTDRAVPEAQPGQGAPMYRPAARRAAGWIGAAACLVATFALGWWAGSGGDRRAPGAEDPTRDAPRAAARAPGPASASPGAGTGAQPPSRQRVATAPTALREIALESALVCARSLEPERQLDCLRALDRHTLHQPEVLAAFVQALDHADTLEQRARIAAVLTPVPLAADAKAPLIAALAPLRTARSSALRAEVLPILAQLDRSPAIRHVLTEGMHDPDPVVVEAAIRATQLSTVRTPELKDALLVYAHDAGPASHLRFLALDALRDFELDADDYALYRAARDAQ